MTPKFKWTCSYQGSTWFDVCDETGKYELELRRSADDYERKCYNGDDAHWQRNVVDMIGVLRRSHSVVERVPDSTVLAFNAWRTDEHKTHCAEIARQPERYGDYVPAAPQLACAAAQWVQTGYMQGHWTTTLSVGGAS